MARRNASTLKVEVVGDASKLDKELEGVSGKMKRFGGNVSKAGGTLTKWVTGPIAGAIGGVAALAKREGERADALLDAQAATGASTATLQEYEHVASQAGVSQDFFTSASKDLTRQMSSASSGTGRAAEAFDKLGVEVKNADGTMRESGEVTEEAIEKLAGIEDQGERAAVAQDLFKGSQEEVLAVVSQGSDEIARQRDEAHELGRVQSGESLDAANEFRKGLERLKGMFGGLMSTIGGEFAPLLTDRVLPIVEDRIVPALRGFVERVAGLARWFTNLSGPMQALIVGFVGLLAAVGPILLVVGKVISLVGTLTPLFTAVAGAISLPVVAIGAFVAALVVAYTTSETFRTIVHAAFTAVADVVRWAWENVIRPAFQQLVGWVNETLLPTIRRLAATFVEDVWPRIAQAVEWAWEGVIKPAWDAIKATVVNVLVPTIRTLGSVVGTVFSAIGSAISAAWNNVVKPVWDTISWTIENVLAPVFRFIKAVVEDVFGVIATVVRIAWNEQIKPIWEAIKGFIDDPLAPAFEAFRDVAGDVWDAVSGAVATAWDTVRPIFESIREWVADRLTPVWETFREAASDAWGALKGIVQSALSALSGPVETFLSMAAKVADAIGMGNLSGVLSSAASTAAGWSGGGMGVGGAIGRHNKGGRVPGFGPDRDTVPAMLTPGEFVLNRRAAARIPDRVLQRLNDPAWQLPRRGVGGTGGDVSDLLTLNAGGWAKGPDEVINEARRQTGPYQWGGFGPTFDCSGFLAWLSNFAATGHGRRGGRWATGMAGGPQLGRFVRGEGDPETGFAIGVNTRAMTPSGRPGHTAGTVAGTNVESAGGVGSHVGGNRGAGYGRLSYHLPDYGGPSRSMREWFAAIGDALSFLTSPADTPLGDVWRSGANQVARGAAGWLIDQVPFGGILRDIAGLAEGGTATSAGTVRVGEDGAELVTLPRGAAVTPESDLSRKVDETNRLLRDLIAHLEEGLERPNVQLVSRDDVRADAQAARLALLRGQR